MFLKRLYHCPNPEDLMYFLSFISNLGPCIVVCFFYNYEEDHCVRESSTAVELISGRILDEHHLGPPFTYEFPLDHKGKSDLFSLQPKRVPSHFTNSRTFNPRSLD